MLPAERNPRIDRVGFELRAKGIKPDQMHHPLRSGTHGRGYLPHVKKEGATYFVTFRLADSLPNDVLMKFQAERAQRLTSFYAQQQTATKAGKNPPSKDILDEIERDYFRKVEGYLDRGCGECWLKKPEITELVANSISHFDGEKYLVKAWVVMPNHVHLVIWPMPNHTLSDIMRDMKRFTAREANKILKRTGEAFWQQEPYDHWIRNAVEHERCCRYTVNNPVKAKLCASPEHWPWSSAWRSGKAK